MACGGARPLEGVGMSARGGAGARREVPPKQVDAGPVVIPADFRTAMTRLNRQRFPSRGHLFERFLVDVYANAVAREALTGSGSGAFPVGAVFVKEHFEGGQAGGVAKAGAVMMMEKRAAGFDPERGDWRYVVVNATGEVEGDGALAGCAACHGEAGRDHVFRVE
jgi:Cytochrome P460